MGELSTALNSICWVELIACVEQACLEFVIVDDSKKCFFINIRCLIKWQASVYLYITIPIEKYVTTAMPSGVKH